MEVFTFIRLQARPGDEEAVSTLIAQVLPPSREEEGCRMIEGFRDYQVAGLFYIHACWSDEDAFVLHTELAHTVTFREAVSQRIDHPFAVSRTNRMEPSDG